MKTQRRKDSREFKGTSLKGYLEENGRILINFQVSDVKTSLK